MTPLEERVAEQAGQIAALEAMLAIVIEQSGELKPKKIHNRMPLPVQSLGAGISRYLPGIGSARYFSSKNGALLRGWKTAIESVLVRAESGGSDPLG